MITNRGRGRPRKIHETASEAARRQAILNVSHPPPPQEVERAAAMQHPPPPAVARPLDETTTPLWCEESLSPGPAPSPPVVQAPLPATPEKTHRAVAAQKARMKKIVEDNARARAEVAAARARDEAALPPAAPSPLLLPVAPPRGFVYPSKTGRRHFRRRAPPPSNPPSEPAVRAPEPAPTSTQAVAPAPPAAPAQTAVRAPEPAPAPPAAPAQTAVRAPEPAPEPAPAPAPAPIRIMVTDGYCKGFRISIDAWPDSTARMVKTAIAPLFRVRPGQFCLGYMGLSLRDSQRMGSLYRAEWLFLYYLPNPCGLDFDTGKLEWEPTAAPLPGWGEFKGRPPVAC